MLPVTPQDEGTCGALWAEGSQGVDVEVDGWTGDVAATPAPGIHGSGAVTPR